jgi:hypothetical protein
MHFLAIGRRASSMHDLPQNLCPSALRLRFVVNFFSHCWQVSKTLPPLERYWQLRLQNFDFGCLASQWQWQYKQTREYPASAFLRLFFRDLAKSAAC